MKNVLLTLKKVLVGALFVVMAFMPVVSFAAVSIPSGYEKLDDVAYEFITHCHDKDVVMKTMGPYTLKNHTIVGKLGEIGYEKNNKNKVSDITLYPVDGALGKTCFIVSGKFDDFKGKIGDIIAFKGHLFKDVQIQMTSLLALQLGQSATFVFEAVETPENLTTGGSGGMSTFIFVVLGAVVLGGGFYFYKKKNGNISVEDIKSKTSEAMSKAKNSVNIDEIKAKAEEAKDKVTKKIENLKDK